MKHVDCLTRSYPFSSLSIGDCFVVNDRFQHARVAASEYARKYGVVMSCRMQPNGSMKVYRVANDQVNIDRRGSIGKRRIDRPAVELPTVAQFNGWLQTIVVGQTVRINAAYSTMFDVMRSLVELYCIKHGVVMTVIERGEQLIISRSR